MLIKTRGKTTTDQISPAGTWLRYRGHLDRFSDNLLCGAIDAFTGRPRADVAKPARELRARGIRWVVVGDANYGEGSSREHAALSPRWLGGAAVIARSFARIHESNLKKQGLLALTLPRRRRLRAHPRGRPRQPAGARAARRRRSRSSAAVRHADGTSERLWLAHSYSEAQLEWFRAGSALLQAAR